MTRPRRARRKADALLHPAYVSHSPGGQELPRGRKGVTDELSLGRQLGMARLDDMNGGMNYDERSTSNVTGPGHSFVGGEDGAGRRAITLRRAMRHPAGVIVTTSS